MDTSKDYYATLGVLPAVPIKIIKAAYKAMLSIYHPDKFQGSKEKAHRKTIEINQAYKVLSDPELRKEYDSARVAEGNDHFENKVDNNYQPKAWGNHSSPKNTNHPLHTNHFFINENIQNRIFCLIMFLLVTYSTYIFLIVSFADLNPVFGRFTNWYILFEEDSSIETINSLIDQFEVFFGACLFATALGWLSINFIYRQYIYTKYVTISFFSAFLIATILKNNLVMDIWLDLELDSKLDKSSELGMNFSNFLWNDMSLNHLDDIHPIFSVVWLGVKILVVAMPFISFYLFRKQYFNDTYNEKINYGDLFQYVIRLFCVFLASSLFL